MPNRAIHVGIGAAAGGATAYWRSQGRPEDRLLESIGGTLTGAWSGTWADLFEPAYTPHHRGPAHAIVPNAVVWSIYGGNVAAIQQGLRLRADEYLARSYQTDSTLEFVIDQFLSLICRLLAGAVVGIPAGYLSHVALDALTPMGVGFIGAKT